MARGLSEERYNAGARALHWAIAVLILVNIALGLLHEPLDGVVSLMPVHKAIGMSVLALSVLRLVWRMTWTAPPYPETMSGLEVLMAKLVHVALYLFMLAMPLTGWIMTSSGKYPLTWFGLFSLPKLPVTKGSALVELSDGFHSIGGWLLLALALGHAAAALRHHFVLRDGVLRRML